MGVFKNIAILVNHEKPGARDAIESIKKWVLNFDGIIIINDAEKNGVGFSPFGSGTKEELINLFKTADILISLGGDGTLLFAAQIAGSLKIPVLSVNLGSLGFHTQVNLSELDSALDRLKIGDFHLENRLMLKAHLDNNGEGQMEEHLALNDIVISKSVWGHMVSLRLFIDEEVVTDVNADALIIASPTGSSAYNYAAGGPVVHPKMHSLVINAICPHRMKLTPLVVPLDSIIDVQFRPKRKVDESQVLVDGQAWLPIMPQSHLKISRADVYLSLIKFENDFYGNLRDKLRWGGLF